MAVKRRGFVAGAAVGAGVIAAAAAGAGVHWPASADAQPARGESFAGPPSGQVSFADIFSRVSPAVVTVDVTTRLTAKELSQIPGFEGLIPQQPGPQGQGQGRNGRRGGAGRGGAPSLDDLPETQAAGSGFFISPDGYIVTNNHVVENATSIKVTLNDKRELKARVVGRDEGTDLAVLKVDGAGFPFVDFEDRGRPRVGDWVLAIGNPFGLGGSATAGIVSAYGRDIDSQFVDYLQIDAPINRGNSGGPTFDAYGRVIGVNTAIFSPSGGSVGIGFAIPADIASKITRQLISGKTITRGYLGVAIGNVSEDVAASQGLAPNTGALVADVTAGGPAARAGVQPLDVIVAVNGQPVTSSPSLSRLTANAAPGDALRLDLVRGGRRLSVVARAGVRPSQAQLDAANQNGGVGGGSDDQGGPGAEAHGPTAVGLTLGVLSPAARQRLNLPETVRGVLIEDVADGSDAKKKGLQAGDVIQRVGDRAAATPADVVAGVAEARRAGRPVLLLISRDGRTVPIAIKTQPDAPTPSR